MNKGVIGVFAIVLVVFLGLNLFLIYTQDDSTSSSNKRETQSEVDSSSEKRNDNDDRKTDTNSQTTDNETQNHKEIVIDNANEQAQSHNDSNESETQQESEEEYVSHDGEPSGDAPEAFDTHYIEANDNYITLQTLYSGKGDTVLESRTFTLENDNYPEILKASYEYGLSSKGQFVLQLVNDENHEPVGVICRILGGD